MKKYSQYRILKKVEKLLDVPVKEDVYTPPNNVFLSTKGLGPQDNILDARCTLRMAQIEAIARLLLQQISLLQRLDADAGHQIDSDSKRNFDRTSAEILILFEEMDSGLLLTDAEKDAQRLKFAKSEVTRQTAENQARIDLSVLVSQVQDWQQEKSRRKKRFNRLHASIRELALNVNDIRCAQILRDSKTSFAALSSTIDLGLLLLRDIFQKVQIVCSSLERTL